MPKNNPIAVSTLNGIRYELDTDRENGGDKLYVYWRESNHAKRKSLKCSDPVEGQKLFAEFQRKLDPKAAAETGNVYVIADLWETYFEKHIKGTASEEGAGFAWANLKQHFSKLTCEEVTQEVADEFVRLRTTGKIGRKVLPQTVRKELTFLNACMNFCSGKRRGPKMVSASQVQAVARPDDGEARERWLDTDEIEKLLQFARADRRYTTMSRVELFIYLALYTAGRESAIMDLTWSKSIDFKRRTINLKVDSVRLVDGRKRKMKGRAFVPMHDVLYDVLQQAYAERENDLVMGCKSSCRESIYRIAYLAGLAPEDYVAPERGTSKSSGVGPHVLRHTAATHMAMEGVSLWDIAKILGNTYEVVEKHYANFVPNERARASVNMIPAPKFISAPKGNDTNVVSLDQARKEKDAA